MQDDNIRNTIHDADLESLIDAYLEGATTPADERRLLEALRTEPDPDPTHRALLAAMAAMRTPPAAMPATPRRRAPRIMMRLTAIAAAACIAAVAVTAWQQSRYNEITAPAGDCVAYVGGERITSPEEVQSIAMAQLGEFGRASAELDDQVKQDLSSFGDAVRQQ